MSYPVWPEALTRFERGSWQVQSQDARLRRQSDAGPPGYRRRFSLAATTVGLSIVLTQDERAVFDRFFAETTAGGSRLFWMPDPSRDGWPILGTDGSPLLSGDVPLLMSARWLCLFGDQMPTETIVDQIDFRKSFSVVVMP